SIAENKQYTHTDLLVIERPRYAPIARDSGGRPAGNLCTERKGPSSLLPTARWKTGVNYSEITPQPALSLTASCTMPMSVIKLDGRSYRMYDRREQHRQSTNNNLRMRKANSVNFN